MACVIGTPRADRSPARMRRKSWRSSFRNPGDPVEEKRDIGPSHLDHVDEIAYRRKIGCAILGELEQDAVGIDLTALGGIDRQRGQPAADLLESRLLLRTDVPAQSRSAPLR